MHNSKMLTCKYTRTNCFIINYSFFCKNENKRCDISRNNFAIIITYFYLYCNLINFFMLFMLFIYTYIYKCEILKIQTAVFLIDKCFLPIHGSASDLRVSGKASIALLETGARSFWPFLHDTLSNASVQIGNRFSYSLSQPILHSYSHSHLCISHFRTVRILHILHSHPSQCHNITVRTHLPKFMSSRMSTIGNVFCIVSILYIVLNHRKQM